MRASRLEPVALPRWAVVTARRRAHIRRVAALLAEWGRALRVDELECARWLRAAALHDAMKDAPPDVIATLAMPRLGPPSLWHGPAAARRAEQEGERDPGVLSAVRYHSVGFAGWDRVGRMLYLADYLEPGRRFDATTRDRWIRRLPKDPDGVLRGVAAARLTFALRKGWPLLPESVEFWNALG
jgi:2-amino-4-hydroxy-6-hydroxymethyldihydropteridine diphosphokinase